jgi:hypothetical protein
MTGVGSWPTDRRRSEKWVLAAKCTNITLSANDRFVGIAVLKMINLFVCFSLIAVSQV